MKHVTVCMTFTTDDVDELDGAARAHGFYRFPDRVFVAGEPGEDFEAIVVETVLERVLNNQHVPLAEHAELLGTSVHVMEVVE